MSEAAAVADLTGEAVKGGHAQKRNYERLSFVLYSSAVLAALSVPGLRSQNQGLTTGRRGPLRAKTVAI